MRSYASIDRIEGKFAICEVEMIEVDNSKAEDFSEKETEMMDVLLEVIYSSVGNVEEGDILIVEHNENDVTEVYCKDEEEKKRRVAILQELLG